MLNIIASIFIGFVYLSCVVAEPQNPNSREAQYNPESMPENTGPTRPPPQYEKPRQEYSETNENKVLNIGNGHNKHNFVIINQDPRRPINVDGTFRNTGNNQRNFGENVNFGNRFGSENIPPVTNSNPRPVYTNSRRVSTINNVGNGHGNTNWIVIQDTPNGGRTVSTIPNYNFQNPNNNAGTTYRRQQVNSNIPYTYEYNRIGHGPNNYNRVVVNGQTVYDTESESPLRPGEQNSNKSFNNNNNLEDDKFKVLPRKTN